MAKDPEKYRLSQHEVKPPKKSERNPTEYPAAIPEVCAVGATEELTAYGAGRLNCEKALR
jgi:hypothetical protein